LKSINPGKEEKPYPEVYCLTVKNSDYGYSKISFLSSRKLFESIIIIARKFSASSMQQLPGTNKISKLIRQL
jgi:hypothetical protein